MAWQIRVFTNGAETTSFIYTVTYPTREEARQFVKDSAHHGIWDNADNKFYHPRQRRAFAVEEI